MLSATPLTVSCGWCKATFESTLGEAVDAAGAHVTRCLSERAARSFGGHEIPDASLETICPAIFEAVQEAKRQVGEQVERRAASIAFEALEGVERELRDREGGACPK